ncbi:MFS transporter [Sporichthya sp.]|uniref:MFS transporter n=1 Tax=Sporichthya sp. TaxID=65475 RepID=UPI00183D478C|nr:MFS transporter [Sporichthya sp.]MBA3744099.1 MFS transporter [Sporichthya sp.]
MVAIAAPETAPPDGPPRTRYRMPAWASFALLASMAFTFLAAASAPTPLYGVYQDEWGFSAMTTTIVFSVYAVSVLGALLTVGALSDHVGRRPVLFGALGAQAMALILFVIAENVPVLMAARFVQGISTGAAIGAMGAGMLDLSKLRGATASAVAPMLGTGAGAVISGAFVQWLPAPQHLIYLVMFGLFALQAVGVAFMPETVTPKPGALASLKPQFALPAAARRPLIAAAPAMIACWSMAGLYGSLGPALVHRITGSVNHVYGGGALFVLAASGAVAVLALQNTAPHTSMVIGTAALFSGVGLTLFAGDASSLGFFLAAIVAGTGFGAAFQGALRSVVMVAGPHERAGVVSVLFVISYVAFGGPAIIAGLLVVETGDIMATSQYYGGAVMVLAAFALVAMLRQNRPVKAAALAEAALAEVAAVEHAAEARIVGALRPGASPEADAA